MERRAKETAKWRLQQSQPRLRCRRSVAATSRLVHRFTFWQTKNLNIIFSASISSSFPPKHIIYIFIRICANINFCIFFNFSPLWARVATCSTISDFPSLFSLHSFLQNRQKKCTNLLWRLNLNTKTTYQVTFGTARHFSRSFLFYFFYYIFACKNLNVLHLQYFSSLCFPTVVIHGVNVTHMSTQIKTAVDIEQKKILWVPVKMDWERLLTTIINDDIFD